MRPAVPEIKRLGKVEYRPTWAAMRRLTDSREPGTPDEIWLLEHPPVYTLGLAGRHEHLLAPGDIEVLQVDRGGQVTYHGPGQLVVYTMLDLRRMRFGARDLVCALERTVLDVLARYGISGQTRAGAPGVFVDGRKVASLGLRIRRGCSYHGLAFNVAMDLEPFTRIDPCGFAGLEVTQLADLGGPADITTVAAELEPRLRERLGYNAAHE